MSFKVNKPGILSLLQDAGRFGYQHLGITPGGPMDEHALHWCNALLNNTPDSPVLEVTYGQLELTVNASTTICITGADLDAKINDKNVKPWRTYFVSSNDQISFDRPKTGLRAYLAVVGGFHRTLHLGSCATVTRDKMDGLNCEGIPLKAGDILYFTPTKSFIEQNTPKCAIENYDAPLELGVIASYQFRDFSEKQ